MKGRKLAAAAAICCAALAAAPPARAEGDDLERRARALVSKLATEEFEAAGADFDATLRSVLPPAKLGQVWKQIVAMAGPLQGVGDARREEAQGYRLAILRCQFQSMALDARVAFDKDGKVAGLLFLPVAVPAAGPPAYADPKRFEEAEVTVGATGWPLPGTLATPTGDGPFPAVVLVHGSGPHDRDETCFGAKVFRDIAWGLASKGVAALRYEKRTKAHAARFTAEITIEEETIADALAALAAARKAPRVDPKRVFVVGHSLGAMAAPEIARRDQDAAGAVLLAGPARRLEEVLLEQNEYLALADGQVTAEELERIAQAREWVKALRERILTDDATVVGPGLAPRYFRALAAIDPVATARALGRPLLVLQGGRDIQVSALHDFLPLREALAGTPTAALRLYPRLNHLFVAGEGPSTLAEYQKAANVDEKVVADLAAWVATGRLPPE